MDTPATGKLLQKPQPISTQWLSASTRQRIIDTKIDETIDKDRTTIRTFFSIILSKQIEGIFILFQFYTISLKTTIKNRPGLFAQRSILYR
ncbi:MAG: hypothetical protein ACE5IT_02340 [bacterium]